MKRYDLITPEGTRDLLFEECRDRRSVEQRLARLFEGFGYSQVVTPGIEFYDAFSGSVRYFRQERMYKLSDSKGRIMVLRPDCTVPIARLAATRLKEAGTPLRLYYNQSVYTNNALLKGQSDETMQAGIELIGGENSRRADYEALCTALEALASFDKDNFRLEIGHIGYFKELVKKLGVDEVTREEMRTLISSKDFPALNDLLDDIGDNEITRALKQLPSLFGGPEVLDKAAKLYADDNINEILTYLKTVHTRLSSLGCGDKISFDLGIVSHIHYYTGIVFRGYLSEVGSSVLTGGRYDNLVASFGRDVPAVGFGVNVDSIVRHLERTGAGTKAAPVDAVIYGEKHYVVEAIGYAQRLVREGARVEMSLFDTYEDTLEYAKKLGIKKIIRIGETVTETEVGEGQ